MSEPEQTGWWRRNRWPLVALAVLLPGTIVLTTWSEWADYQDSYFSRPITVAPSQTGAYAGASFTVVDSELVRGADAAADELGLDAGLDLVVAVVEVRPGDQVVDSCTLSVAGTSREQPQQRTWDANIDLPSGLPQIEGTQDYCVGTGREPFTLRVAATVPRGAVDRSAWLTIEVFGNSPDYLVLMLPPGSE